MKLKRQKKTRTIVGIDYSLTSPAVCIDNGNLMFYYLTSKIKYSGAISEDIFGYKHKEWKDAIERFTYISDFVMDLLSKCYNPQIFIEGYSFGSKGQAVFQIAENGGILKYRLQKRFTCKTIVPSVVKNLATGKGNADKQKMYEAFTKTQGVDLMKAFDQQTLNNPITDIVDSYFIMRAGFENSISNNI